VGSERRGSERIVGHFHLGSYSRGEPLHRKPDRSFMRRPSRVKSFCSFRDFFFFSGSARPPLSPPFHPHS